MTKDHFVPQAILKNFGDSNGKIMFYSKRDNKISKPVSYLGQLQKGNFHSKKTLAQLKEEFPHITINPIFENNKENNLETALGNCLESPLGVIISRILKLLDELLDEPKSIIFSEEGGGFIKEYITIQHIRTLKFKELSREFNEKFSLPPGLRGELAEMEHQRDVQIRALIKARNPRLNSRERFEKEKVFRRKLKKNPALIKEIRDRFINEELDSIIQNAEKEIKEILLHPEKHSADIIDVKQRNSFFSRCGIEQMNVVLVWNQTDIPFVLADTGLVFMSDDPDANKNLEIFLPIHPRFLIGLSKTMGKNSIVGETFVNNFNQLSKEACYLTVYSNSEDTLQSLAE